MKRLVFVCAITVLLFNKAFAQLGSDWPATCFSTPNHNLICDDKDHMMEGGYINHSLGHFKKWYYYKDRIIGQGPGYFIIDEKGRDSLFRSSSEKEWLLQIERKQLKPALWTKWYTMDDGRDYDARGFDSEWSKYSSYYLLGLLALIIAMYIDVSRQTNGRFLVGSFLALLAYRVWLYIAFDCLNNPSCAVRSKTRCGEPE